MGKGSAPAAPDPQQTADAQQKINTQSNLQQAEFNRVNQYNPYGSSVWTITGQNADGTPQYSQTTSLNPQLQSVLNGQLAQDQNLIGTQNNLIGQIAGNHVPSQNQFNPLQTTAGAASNSDMHNADYQTAGYGHIQDGLGQQDLQHAFDQQQQAAYHGAMLQLQPQFQNQRDSQVNQLAQQGITAESNPAAYQRAMDQLNRDQSYQQQQAYANSYGQGLQGANQLFNQNLQSGQFANQAQQQGFNQSAFNAQQGNTAALQNAAMGAQTDMFNAGANNAQSQFNAQLNNQANAQGLQNAMTLYNAPVNTLASLRGLTQVQNPQFSQYSQVAGQAAPNYMQAAQNNYQAQLGNYNNQMNGLFNLGSTAMMLL